MLETLMDTYEIDTSKLLQCLKSNTGKLSLSNRRLKARNVRSRSDIHLIFVVGLNFGQFFNQGGMVDWETAEL